MGREERGHLCAFTHWHTHVTHILSPLSTPPPTRIGSYSQGHPCTPHTQPKLRSYTHALGTLTLGKACQHDRRHTQSYTLSETEIGSPGHQKHLGPLETGLGEDEDVTAKHKEKGRWKVVGGTEGDGVTDTETQRKVRHSHSHMQAAHSHPRPSAFLLRETLFSHHVTL